MAFPPVVRASFLKKYASRLGREGHLCRSGAQNGHSGDMRQERQCAIRYKFQGERHRYKSDLFSAVVLMEISNCHSRCSESAISDSEADSRK